MDNLTDEKIELYNKLYKKATDRFNPYVLIENQSSGYVGWFVKLKIKKSIKELNQCLEIIPKHINSTFLLGKCFQSLGDDNSSLVWFERGLETKFEELNYEEDITKFGRLKNYCLLEASVIYAKMGDFKKSIDYGNRLLNSDPKKINVVSILTNQAMNLIITGKDEEAENFLNEAISLGPSDSITIKVKDVLYKIRNGQINRPTTWNGF